MKSTTHTAEVPYQILVVEDDQGHVELISRSFELYTHFMLVIVNNLQDAQTELLNINPDLIISDISLPDGKGTELLETVNKSPSCPVVVMTSFGDETVAVNAMKAGAVDYIVKSQHSFDELPAIANRILREWRLVLEKKVALAQQNRLTTILEASPDLICIADVDGFLTYLNQAGYALLGLNEDEPVSKIRLADFHTPEDTQLIIREGIPNAIKHGIWKTEVTFVTQSKQSILTSLVLLSHKNQLGDIEFFSTVARDIRDIRLAEEKIEYLAYYDTLTDLPNRNELLRQLEYEIGRVKRQQTQSALLFVDLDNFKYVNDSLGHPTGDLVLKEVATRLKQMLRSEDILARLGGDEFVVILTSLSANSIEAINQARDVSKKLNAYVAREMQIGKLSFNLTISIGISMFSSETKNADELLRFADMAMYEAKKSGKNQFEVFHQDMGEQIQRQFELEHKLRRAHNNKEFILYYQPKIETTTGLIHGAEALIRWLDPDNGLTTPAIFLDVLESSDLMTDVGKWVLEESFKQLALWIAEGAWNTQHRLSINVSARQFLDDQFSITVINLLDKINLPPQCIDIEITEHSVIHDMNKAVAKMKILIEKGLTFSLDDFGTGYSSLSYLKSLPVATVKIDRSFIRDICDDGSDKALVISILDIANNLNLSVVAEGVETAQQMQMLKQYQCHYLQGYLFSKPLPVEEFKQLLIE